MTTGISDGGEFLAPWRQVSTISDTEIVYYAATHESGCIPCLPSSSPTLSRHVLHQPELRSLYTDAPDNSALSGKRVLVIVNPTSGSGAASAVKSNVATLVSILVEAALEPVVLYTERHRHAVQLVADHAPDELARFAAVVAVGGDGTLHEILNGLVKVFQSHGKVTTNWSDVPPIAVLAAGSGNAIAASTGLKSAQHAALNIVHSLRTGAAKPMAVMVMRYSKKGGDGSELSAVGGMQWGFTANVDQGTECLRWLGDVRFDVGAALHIAKRRTAHARIKVTVDVAQHERVASDIESERKRRTGASRTVDYGEKVGEDSYLLEGNFVMCVAWNAAFIAEGFKVTPKACVTETGMFDFIVVRDDISRGEMLKMMTSVEDGSFMWKTESFVYYKATRIEFEQLEGEYLTIDGESAPVKPFVLEMAPQDGKIRILDSFSDPVPAPQSQSPRFI